MRSPPESDDQVHESIEAVGGDIEGDGALIVASCDPLNPLASPPRGLEGFSEVLRLVHNLTVAELHDAYGESRPALICDDVFRNPEIASSENPPDVKT